MRLQPEAIKLGVHQWVVRPLTLRQVQEIEPYLLDGALGGNGSIGAAMGIVTIALRRDHAEAAAQLSDIEATAPEIGVAVATILRLGGFIQAQACGDQPPGEGVAGVTTMVGAPASTSGESTPA
jgi:hypothetical protein